MGKGHQLGTGPLNMLRDAFDTGHYNCQICLAPDYVLVPRDFQDTFVAALQRAYVYPFSACPKTRDLTQSPIDSTNSSPSILSRLQKAPWHVSSWTRMSSASSSSWT